MSMLTNDEVKNYLKNMALGTTTRVLIGEAQIAAIRIWAKRSGRGKFSLKRVKGTNYYDVSLHVGGTPKTDNARINEELAKRLDEYVFSEPREKVHNAVYAFNAKHDTHYSTQKRPEGGTRVVRNKGMEVCAPFVRAWNFGDAATLQAEFQKLGYTVRAKLLQMGMGVTEQPQGEQ